MHWQRRMVGGGVRCAMASFEIVKMVIRTMVTPKSDTVLPLPTADNPFRLVRPTPQGGRRRHAFGMGAWFSVAKTRLRHGHIIVGRVDTLASMGA